MADDLRMVDGTAEEIVRKKLDANDGWRDLPSYAVAILAVDALYEEGIR